LSMDILHEACHKKQDGYLFHFIFLGVCLIV
jgi:hypothetical protein